MNVSMISPTGGVTPAGSTTSGTGPLAVSGLVSGIDTTSLINALMVAYEQPQVNLQQQQSAVQTQITDWQALNSKLAALQTASDAINTVRNWSVVTAGSSNTAVATATGGSGATPGAITFTVNQLAAADTMASSGTVSSTSAVVTSASDLLLSQGGGSLGFTSLASSGLLLGAHTVDVTQASAAATTVGGLALAPSTTIQSGTNDTFQVSIDGVAYTYTLSSGTYTPAQLAAAVSSASGGTLNAVVNGSGELLVGTTEQGSAASLQITGGTSLGSLGLSPMGSAVTGVDGVVNVDGTATTLTSLKAGQSVSLPSGTGGSVNAVLSGGVSTGSITATDVSTGNGSLSSVVSAINNAGTGITAAAVQTGASSYVLQLAAKSTGVASSLSVDASAFSSSALGSLNTITAGADAKLTVGGTGGYTVDSASNTVTGLLAGVSVNLVSTSASPVTVTSTPDSTTMANDVHALVTAANSALSAIQQYAGYNATTKQAGPLLGNPIIQSIQQSIYSSVASAVGPNGLSSGTVGVTIDSQTGQIDFDQSAFATAYQANPNGVASLFSKGGTLAPAGPARTGDVSLLYAGDSSVPGSYDVTISQSATQATDTGAVLAGGTITGAETLTVQTGGTSVNYAASAGASLAAIAAGLNSAFASSNLALTAAVVNSGQQLQITSNQYGSAASFQVTSTATGGGQTGLAAVAGTPQTFGGIDVAGRINGVAATGSGQVLTAPTTDPTLAGISLLVTTPGVSSSTSLGSFTYTAGLGGEMAAAAWSASNPVNGGITTTIQGLQSEYQNLGTRITAYNPLIASEKLMLQQQFQAMETQLGNLKSQGDYLSNQLSQLPTL
jgi:flagellar hook-associated protein 2